MQVALFEDEKFSRFLPLAHTRPVFYLPLAGRRIADWLLDELKPDVACGIVRDYLRELALEKGGPRFVERPEEGEVLLVNGRLRPSVAGQLLARLRPGSFLLHGEDAVAARLNSGHLSRLSEKGGALEAAASKLRALGLEPLRASGTPLIEHLWELHDESRASFLRRFSAGPGKLGAGLYALGDVSRLYVDEGAEVASACHIDTSGGPVYIARGARLEPFSVVQGPCYLAEGVRVHGAKVREGSWIGPVVRLGGEVEESLIAGYSNKAHEGFLGHSVIGEWVNIGSGAQFSDLKNTYGTVRVVEGPSKVDTGRQKVGAFIGDDAKISIGTLIYSGIRIGVASHVAGLVNVDVPSFTLYMNGRAAPLDLDKALEIRRRMMARRSLALSRAEQKVLEEVFYLTKEERERSPLLQA